MNWKLRVVCMISLLSLVVVSSMAQSEAEKEKIRQLEIQRQADRQRAIGMKLDSAVVLMDHGNYEVANEMFLSILKTVRSVPSDLTYYFGKNSFYLGKFRQSADWLNKYIQLKGMSGQFSQEAVSLKKQAEAEILKEKNQEVKQASQVLAYDYDIDCGPAGKVTCPVCNGTTVIIKKGYISDTYKTCNYCQLKGTLSCEDYNKLLRGELKPSTN